MEQYELKEMLTHVADGSVSVEEAVRRLKRAPFEEIGIASLDAHRGIRQGASEIIYGAGKTAAQIAKIAESLRSGGQQTILITRVDAEKAEAVREALAADVPFTYFAEGRIGLVGKKAAPRREGYILVATGGTSDIPVAEEAALTAEILGNHVRRVYDVGVAGLHRLLAHLDDIMGARVIMRSRAWRVHSRRHRRSDRCAGHRSTDQCRLRYRARRRDRTAFDAQFLCQRRQRREYRQWIRCRLSGGTNQQYGGLGG